MVLDENTRIENLIERLRELVENPTPSPARCFRVIGLAQSVLYETVGINHPLMKILDNVLSSDDPLNSYMAGRNVLDLYDEGGLISPRLAIAREIEGDILDIAERHVEDADRSSGATKNLIHLGISAFLAGAALEDALRRLCDANGISYDSQHTSISKLQTVLYQPKNQIEIISGSDNKDITKWGATRNKADHGRFSEITHPEAVFMVNGVRGFINNNLS